MTHLALESRIHSCPLPIAGGRWLASLLVAAEGPKVQNLGAAANELRTATAALLTIRRRWPYSSAPGRAARAGEAARWQHCGSAPARGAHPMGPQPVEARTRVCRPAGERSLHEPAVAHDQRLSGQSVAFEA